MAKVNGPREWSQWVDWLAAGLHGRHRWRLAVVFTGMLLAGGRRTVTSWLRAAAVGDHFSGYYYFIAAVGRNTSDTAWRLLALIVRQLPLEDRVLLVIDDSPTKRYGPKVEGADIHHNPTPGPGGPSVSVRPSTTASRRCPGHGVDCRATRRVGRDPRRGVDVGDALGGAAEVEPVGFTPQEPSGASLTARITACRNSCTWPCIDLLRRHLHRRRIARALAIPDGSLLHSRPS